MSTIKSVTAVINGQEYLLEYDSSSGQYKKTLTAPQGSSFNNEGGYYPVSVTASYTTGTTVTVNDKTDGTIGENCRLVVKERIKPVSTIQYPTHGQYITSELKEIQFTVLDNFSQSEGYSGINLDTLVLKISGDSLDEDIVINDKEKFSVSPITGGYNCSVELQDIPDGNYTITLNVSDNDGNAAEEKTISVVIDTAPPELSVVSPTEGLNTANDVITISGTTSDITSSPVTVDVTINGEDKGTIAVDESGQFSKEFTLTTSGNQVIVITATDTAGKTSSVTRNIYFSTDIPVIKTVLLVPNEVDGGKTFTICVEVD